jgi:creatinine amidohydrolase
MAEARLEHSRRPEMLARDFDVAAVPIGSTEPHADHLTYGTDTVAVTAFAERAVAEANARGATCLLLPTMPYGNNENVQLCPWAMSLRPRTMMDFVTDVVASVTRNGVRKIVILNGHGGNTSVLQAALRELAPKRDVFIGIAEPWDLSADVEREITETEEKGHACEIETSLMLHLGPAHAKMEEAKPTRIRRSIFSRPGSIYFVNPWHIYTLNTGIGDPTKASAEKGKRMVEAAVDRLADALKELGEAPMDDLFPYVD